MLRSNIIEIHQEIYNIKESKSNLAAVHTTLEERVRQVEAERRNAGKLKERIDILESKILEWRCTACGQAVRATSADACREKLSKISKSCTHKDIESL